MARASITSVAQNAPWIRKPSTRTFDRRSSTSVSVFDAMALNRFRTRPITVRTQTITTTVRAAAMSQSCAVLFQNRVLSKSVMNTPVFFNARGGTGATDETGKSSVIVPRSNHPTRRSKGSRGTAVPVHEADRSHSRTLPTTRNLTGPWAPPKIARIIREFTVG